MTTSIAVLDAANLQSGLECVVETRTITGGTLYITGARVGGGPLVGIATSFAPFAATPPNRYMALTSAKADTGVALTGTATGGAMGISRTAGTSLALVGEATSASAKTDKAMWEINLPDTYVAGAAIPVDINASITGSGTLTAASCTMTLAAYSEINGVEAALVVTGGSIQMTAAGADMTWSIAGTGLVPGSHIALEAAMLVTSSSGANTGQLNSIYISA